MDTALRLERTNGRWPVGPPKVSQRPIGPRIAALVPKDGAPRAASFAWIAAIPNLTNPAPSGAGPAPTVPRLLARALSRSVPPGPALIAGARRAAGRGPIVSQTRALSVPSILARFRDDGELTVLKLGTLGLLILGAASVERLWP